MSTKHNLKDHQYTNLGKITYCLLHDINKTLNSMNINLSLMKEKSRYSEDLVSTSLNGINKISSLLSSANKQLQDKPFRQYFSPSGEINDILDLLSYRLERSSIELDLDIRSEPGEIYGSAVKFSQIVMNLLTNAIDAIEEACRLGLNNDVKNKIQIISKFQPYESKQQTKKDCKAKYRYILEVADNGIGLQLGENDKPEKIFQKGYTTKEKYSQNQGLGLYIVKQIVEGEFLGEIEAISNDSKYSEEPKGGSEASGKFAHMTRFRVSFLTKLS